MALHVSVAGGRPFANKRQGLGDNFYKQKQLLPENFEKAVKDAGVDGVEMRYHDVSRQPTYAKKPQERANKEKTSRTMTILTSSSPPLARTTSSTRPSSSVSKCESVVMDSPLIQM